MSKQELMFLARKETKHLADWKRDVRDQHRGKVVITVANALPDLGSFSESPRSLFCEHGALVRPLSLSCPSSLLT